MGNREMRLDMLQHGFSVIFHCGAKETNIGASLVLW